MPLPLDDRVAAALLHLESLEKLVFLPSSCCSQKMLHCSQAYPVSAQEPACPVHSMMTVCNLPMAQHLLPVSQEKQKLFSCCLLVDVDSFLLVKYCLPPVLLVECSWSWPTVLVFVQLVGCMTGRCHCSLEQQVLPCYLMHRCSLAVAIGCSLSWRTMLGCN